jgi:hypothetical protein
MKSTRSGRAVRKNVVKGMALLAGAVYGIVGTTNHASANLVLDVGLANASTTTTLTGGATGSIIPLTLTPVNVTVPDAPSATYDAADVNTTGTIWNSLESISTSPTVSTSLVLYQTNDPLVDDFGDSTSALLNVYAVEGSGKTDSLHNTGDGSVTSVGNATNGLDPDPANSTYLVASVATNGNGYTASSAQRLLMDNNWQTNSTSDGEEFEVTGLTADEGKSFTLYVYGAGSALGQGGTFSVLTAPGGTVVGTSESTNTSATALIDSVYTSNTGSTLAAAGTSWNELTGTVSATGTVTVEEQLGPSGVKVAMNGFQLDIALPVPEPSSVLLLSMGAAGILTRRRKRLSK